jgi:hypothetical protein
MDFASYDLEGESEKGAVMEVWNPKARAPFLDDKGKPVTITLAGQDSPRYMEAQRKQTASMLDNRGKIKKDLNPIETTAQILAACTVAWSGVGWEGKPLPCTFNNALMLYRSKNIVREQAEIFVSERDNFSANL